MKIRIMLPWDADRSFNSKLERVKALAEVRQDFESSRLKKVLVLHGVRHHLLDHAVFANLGQATSGCSPEDIYCEILLAFDYPLQIFKENNAAAAQPD